jgi:hypothetical protein
MYYPISLIYSPSCYGLGIMMINLIDCIHLTFYDIVLNIKMHLIKTNTIYVGGTWKQWPRQQTTSLSLASNF